MKRILLILAALPAIAQTKYDYIASTGQVAVVAAPYAATLQQPSATCGASGTAVCGLPVSFPVSTVGGSPPAGASIYCSVPCVATIKRNSTAATATAGTVTGVNPTTPPAVIKIYADSNASGGVTLAVIPIPAGSPYPIDMSAVLLGKGNENTNITISVASLTGTVNISFFPVEQH